MGDRQTRLWRNSLRYPGYDYNQPGWVFVTMCVHHRQQLFGSVVDGEMRLSSQGAVAERMCWEIADRVSGVIVDSVVVMPGHMHAIFMTGADPAVTNAESVADLVHTYKIRFQAAYRSHVVEGEWPPYRERLWQRGYHDRIIRNDRELETIRRYIEANPVRWWERRHNV